MKNIINFYYQMNIENIHLVRGTYYFTNNDVSYMFVPVARDPQLLPSLYHLNRILLKENLNYSKLILNKEKMPYIFVDGRCFCLLQISPVISDTMSIYDLRFSFVTVDSELRPLVFYPWQERWSVKLDYLEDLLVHMGGSLEPILPICLFFMGLTENAIQYIRTSETLPKSSKDRLVVSHRRVDATMSVLSLYSPLDLVLDYPARDIAEYFKSLFFHNTYQWSDIEEYIQDLNFSNFEYALLYGRLLYPSFFFDLFDSYLKEEIELTDFFKLGERMEEYRIFLKEMYYIIRRKSKIEEVRWIVRE